MLVAGIRDETGLKEKLDGAYIALAHAIDEGIGMQGNADLEESRPGQAPGLVSGPFHELDAIVGDELLFPIDDRQARKISGPIPAGFERYRAMRLSLPIPKPAEKTNHGLSIEAGPARKRRCEAWAIFVDRPWRWTASQLSLIFRP